MPLMIVLAFSGSDRSARGPASQQGVLIRQGVLVDSPGQEVVMFVVELAFDDNPEQLAARPGPTESGCRPFARRASS